MAIKMIVMDLDGTLLKNDKTIDDLTREYLIRAQKEGVIIVIATGRDKGAIDFVYEPLQLEHFGNNYVAGVNGQIIYSFKKKEYTVDKVLDGKDAQKIMHLAKEMNFEAISCCGYDHYDYATYRWKVMKNIRRLFLGKPMDYGMNQGKRNFIEIHDPSYEIHQDVNKIILIQSANYFRKHLDKIKERLSAYDILKVGDCWIEVMPKGVTKGKAVLSIAEENKIAKDEILVFGDAENDLSMIEAVTYGIAMGNAMDVVKKVAYEVCDTNENQGIAKTIKKYLFHEAS